MGDRIGQSFGNYQLLRLLGKGSFAEVYLGEHRYIDIATAIKVLLSVEPKMHESFRHEARTIARLAHPHIIRIRDFGIQDETPYLVMDYMPNGTLRSCHPRGVPLSYEEIIDYVKQIASALDYAHEQRVIHRDIKPENILLNEKHELLLSDFGLAVVQRPMDTQTTQDQAGTPLYMAPEQIQRHPCPASDQYALAVMVYEWLCGAPPFRGPLFNILAGHMHEPPPSLCAHIPAISPAIEDAVFGALAKDPQERFPTVQDFAIALEESFFATRPMPAFSASPYQSQIPIVPMARPIAPAPTVGIQGGAAPSQPAEHMTPQPSTQDLHIARSGMNSSARTNRQRLLRRVRAFWIEGFLEHSLQGAALMSLGLQEQPDAVPDPWHLMLQQPDAALRPLPAGTSITRAYDSANEALLILGAPGAGKTTLLLELARDLLDRAEHDASHPVPVIFNLSSWTSKRHSLQDWFAEELSNKYQVPRKLGQALVENEEILPLLDGLDEVDVRERTACIHAINLYRQAHGLLPMVVSSRIADYLSQKERLTLSSAVTIQPLSYAQVDEYIASGGEALRALRVALQQDAGMRELAATPLMLNILTLAYQGMPIKDLLWDGIAPTRRQVFERYIDRMLAARETPYQPEQIRNGLAWLARQLKQHGQTVFYIERMQPHWLADYSRKIYNLLAIRLPAVLTGILLGLALYVTILSDFSSSFLLELTLLGGLLGWLLSERRPAQQATPGSGGKAGGISWPRLLHRTTLAILAGLIMAMSFWPSFNLSLDLFFGLRFAICCALLMVLLKRGNRRGDSPRLQSRPQQSVKGSVIFNGLLVGLLVGLVNGLTINPAIDLLHKLISGVLFGLAGGLIAAVLSALLIGKNEEIQPTDKLSWTWKSFGKNLFAKRHVLLALQISIPVGILMGVIVWLSDGMAKGIIFGAAFGLVIGSGYLLFSSFFREIASTTIEDQHRAVPNQGIRHSALNGVIYGLVIALLVGLSVGLTFKWGEGLTAVTAGLIVGLSIGLPAGLSKGGLAYLRHYILRILLWRQGAIPWNYPHFLDTAVDSILLRRVGGGYIFLHRLLLDHFATLETGFTSDKAAGNTAPVMHMPPSEAIQADLLPEKPAQARSPGMLPCGHKIHPGAHYCSVCGAAVPL